MNWPRLIIVIGCIMWALTSCTDGQKADVVVLPDADPFPVWNDVATPDPPDGTDTAELPGPSEDAQACCTPTSCALGWSCDAQSCECIAPPGGCSEVGASCNPNMPTDAAFVCVEFADQTGICREACTGPPLGGDNPCQQGVCAARPGDDGWCLPGDCGGYFDNDCGPDASCLPTLDGSNICVPDGDGEDGQACLLHDECGHDLLCVDDVCADATCSTDPAIAPCPSGVACQAWTVEGQELDAGTCADLCDVFATGQCTEGRWCYPLLNEPEPGPVDGFCTSPKGGAQAGTFCLNDPSVCAPGHICVQSSPTHGECEALCDLDVTTVGAANGCVDGQGCLPLLDSTPNGEVIRVMDFGTCAVACTPWVDASSSGCSAERWCIPTPFDVSFGDCNGVKGTRDVGSACDLSDTVETSCQEGLLCVGAATGGTLDGVCARLCAVDDPIGDTCVAGETCLALTMKIVDGTSIDLAVGACLPEGSSQPDP